MTARASDKLSDLTGVGLEYYIRKDGMIIDFYNGNMVKGQPSGDLEPTLS